MLTPAEHRYVSIMADLHQRGLPHKHRECALLMGATSSGWSHQLFTQLLEKKFVVERQEELVVGPTGKKVWVDAGPGLTEKAWKFLKAQRRAA